MTTMEIPSYRSYLFEEYRRRSSVNASYSLRAYARDLDLSPSRLSEIFSRKNGLSCQNAARIAGVLKLEGPDREVFETSVQASHARSAKQRAEARSRLLKILQRPKEFQIRHDEFRLISDWCHLAILELLSLKGFVLSPRAVSEKLGISVPEAKAAIDRLLRLGWIQMVRDRPVVAEAFRTINSPSAASKALRSFHAQMIRKAERSIEFQRTEDRDLHGLLLAVEKKNLPKAKKLLYEFCKEFNHQVGSKPGDGEAVYALTLQFFEMTESEGKKDPCKSR